ncbi:DUF5672 family protein [Paraburkholderia bannensis]|uniref:DUF5672 family protein n=1 Tax=Paraburkholderia bannensis TaxID=765414 RepID=UPI002AB60189|nr:DUF5672 family protein [Paraburkholderia bannensis]
MPADPNLESVTLVAVTGVADAHGAARALVMSQRALPGARALLCSPVRPAGLPPHIEHRAIAPMNYHEYSLFMLFALWRVVETAFALVVQDDGWVLGPENWDAGFLQYDYIGAPTHLARVDGPHGQQWLDGFRWCAAPHAHDGRIMPVYNGGFSLRSRRMMRALIDNPQIRVEIAPPDFVDGTPLRMRWLGDTFNEDVQLSVLLRDDLEAAGLRFAPPDVARRFALEHAGMLHAGMDLRSVFGLHSRMRALTHLDPPTVSYAITQQEAMQTFGEAQIVNVLLERGYQVAFAPDAAPH